MEYSSNDTKQLYRSVYLLVKHQDERKASIKTIAEIFSNEFIENHEKLVVQSIVLMFEDFEHIGKKSREILWRKGFYDLITLFKKLNKTTAEEQVPKENAENLHNLIESGSNHFKAIIIKIEQMFNLNLAYTINLKTINSYEKGQLYKDLIDRSILSTDNLDTTEHTIYTHSELTYALETIHSLLISLGDLHRYCADFNFMTDDNVTTAGNYSKLSNFYYLEAFKLNPKIGMSHNQLGTLCSGKTYNLESIHHYLHSLVSAFPFDCSENNVSKIFQKNIQYLEANENIDVTKLEQEDYEVKMFIAKFILVVDIFFYDKTVSDFNDLCRSVLLQFKSVINFRNAEHEYHFDENIIFCMISILFCCMVKVNNSEKIYSLNAFMMALCAELVDNCKANMEKCIEKYAKDDKKFHEMYRNSFEKYDKEVRMSRKNMRELPVNGRKESECEKSTSTTEERSLSNKENENLNKEVSLKDKSKKRHQRRRRRAISNDFSDESDISDDEDHDSEFNLSDSNDSDSSFESYDEHSDFSDDNDDEDQREQEVSKISGQITEIKIEEDNEEEKKTIPSNALDKNENLKFKKRYTKFNPNVILNFSENERSLKGLKLLFDWLQSKPEILKDCYKSNPEFISNIMNLLNYFNIDIFSNRYYFEREFIAIDEIRSDLRSIFDLRRKIPTDEDIIMKNFPLFELSQDVLDWDNTYRLDITKAEDSFLRIMKIVDFGFWICKTKKFDYSFCTKARDFVVRVKKERTRSRRNRKRDGKNESRNRRRDRSGRRRRRGGRPKEEEVPKIPVIITKKGYLKNKMNNVVVDDQKPDDDDDLLNNHCEKGNELSKHEIMGKLWLKNEIKTLENKVSRKPANIVLTPYIVLDSICLSEYTAIVKNLVKTKKFIVLVPIAVLRELDDLKKQSEGARNAIKWLEIEFSKGNRFIRAQRAHESTQLPLIKMPKKLDRNSTTFIEIAQFCNHIVSNNPDKDESPDIITYLTGEHLGERKISNFSYIGVLETIPIKFDQIVSFYASYKRK